MQQKSKWFLKDFIAGGTAGVVAKTVTAPIESVKLVLQVQRTNPKMSKIEPYKGMTDAFLRILKEEGFLGLWRGNTVNVIRYVPTQALNFAFKDLYHTIFLKEVNETKHFWRYIAGNLASGGAAGASSLCFVYPLNYAKTRLVTDMGKAKNERQYHGIIDCVVKTFKSDGPRGLYRGFFVSIQCIFFYRACYFGLFDISKELLPDKMKTQFIIAFIVAQAVTTISTIITYPFVTVRRRMIMQIGRKKDEVLYKNTLDCWYKIASVEGPGAFFKGLRSNVVLSIESPLVLVLYDKIELAM